MCIICVQTFNAAFHTNATFLFPTASQMNLQSHPMMKSCRWDKVNRYLKICSSARKRKGRQAIGRGNEAVGEGGNVKNGRTSDEH